MPYDSSLCYASRKKQIENIFLKMSHSCFSKHDQKYSIGGIAKVKYVSKQALSMLMSEIEHNPKSRLPEKLLGNLARCKGFVFDHSIPVEVIWRWLHSSRDNATRDAIEDVISSGAICYALLSKDEDKLLNAHGLRSKMPDSWNNKLDNSNVLLRYTVAKIDVVDANAAYKAICSTRELNNSHDK